MWLVVDSEPVRVPHIGVVRRGLVVSISARLSTGQASSMKMVTLAPPQDVDAAAVCRVSLWSWPSGVSCGCDLANDPQDQLGKARVRPSGWSTDSCKRRAAKRPLEVPRVCGTSPSHRPMVTCDSAGPLVLLLCYGAPLRKHGQFRDNLVDLCEKLGLGPGTLAPHEVENSLDLCDRLQVDAVRLV